MIVIIKPMIPVMVNTSARPRSGPVPNQLPIKPTPAPVVINGMKNVSAMGPIIKVVRGDADCSTLWANPKTRPCLSGGTTF